MKKKQDWSVLLLNEIITYLIFGVLTTLINIMTFKVFISFSISYEIATILSWVFSVIFAFITNKKYVFKSSNNKNKKLIKELFCFFGVRILSLGIDLLCMYICIEIILIGQMTSKILSNIIVVIINYILSKFFIFGQKKDD